MSAPFDLPEALTAATLTGRAHAASAARLVSEMADQVGSTCIALERARPFIEEMARESVAFIVDRIIAAGGASSDIACVSRAYQEAVDAFLFGGLQ